MTLVNLISIREAAYKIETDLDSQLDRLSKRMSLIGQNCKYTTDGVSIIERSDRERAADIHKNEIHVEWTEYRKVISQYIDGYDFVSLKIVLHR